MGFEKHISKAFENLPFDIDITLLQGICVKKVIIDVHKDFATEICIVKCFIIIKEIKWYGNDLVS